MPFDANDPETKAALDAAIASAVEAAVGPLQSSVTKLETNNRTLTTQLKEARKGADIDPADHAKLQETVDTLTAQIADAEKNGKKTVTELTKQLETATNALKSEQGFTTKLLRDNGLSEHLLKVGVEPSYMKAVKAMLGDQVQIVVDGDNRKAVVGDKPLSDFVTEWAASDEAKGFIKAADNGGGGGPGGSKKTGDVTTIMASDKTAFAANLEGIAKGTVKVVAPS